MTSTLLSHIGPFYAGAVGHRLSPGNKGLDKTIYLKFNIHWMCGGVLGHYFIECQLQVLVKKSMRKKVSYNY